MKQILILFTLSFCIPISAQNQNITREARYPLWTYHTEDVSIHGVSVGLFTFPVNADLRNTQTNGLRLELIGFGFMMPLMPKSPVVSTEKAYQEELKKGFSESVNGISLSATGSTCNCLVNGLVIGGLGQINTTVNGLSAVLFFNFAQKHNGFMLGLLNETYEMNGLQAGLSAMAYKSQGLQIGALGSGSETMEGLQIGTMTQADSLVGLQIGLYNRSKKTKGLQIGLWNKNEKRQLPFINWNFNDND
jgi:hypothetical protein